MQTQHHPHASRIIQYRIPPISVDLFSLLLKELTFIFHDRMTQIAYDKPQRIKCDAISNLFCSTLCKLDQLANLHLVTRRYFVPLLRVEVQRNTAGDTPSIRQQSTCLCNKWAIFIVVECQFTGEKLLYSC